MRLHAKQSDPCALRFVNADDFKQTWDVLSMDPDDIKWDAEKLIDPERIKDTDLTANFFTSVDACPPPTEEPTGVPTHLPTDAPTGEPTFAPTAVPTAAPTGVPTVAPTGVPAADRGGVPTDGADGAPTPARGSGEEGGSNTGIIIGAVIGGLLLCLLLAAGVFFMTRKKTDRSKSLNSKVTSKANKQQLQSLMDNEE